MGTAALATRLTTPRTKPVRDRTTCGLNFDDLGGPLVAVCGLTGGAGSTTVALALARQSALESRVPVLIAEHGNPCGGLAAAAGQASPLGLAALSGHLDASQPLPGAFVELAPGLRLIAATPTRHQASAAGALDTLRATGAGGGMVDAATLAGRVTAPDLRSEGPGDALSDRRAAQLS